MCQEMFVKVGGLIGANCSESTEPVEVIPNHKEGQYAFRTLLGWCIVGPVSKITENSGDSNLHYNNF